MPLRICRLLEIPPPFRPAFIGETISLVYAPFYFQDGDFVDGLGDRPIGRASQSDFESIPTLGPEGFRQVRFLPVICPYCGADLQGEKDTQVLLCRNCDRVWDYTRDELKQIDFKTLKDSGEKSQIFYLPFWRIRARISGWPGQMPLPLTRLPLVSDQASAGKTEEKFILAARLQTVPVPVPDGFQSGQPAATPGADMARHPAPGPILSGDPSGGPGGRRLKRGYRRFYQKPCHTQTFPNNDRDHRPSPDLYSFSTSGQ